MAGRAARRKGHDWERQLARLFKEVMPDAQVRRGLQYRSGEEAPDVELPCFFIEAKRHKRTNIKAALKQAADNAPGGRWPLAVCKDDRQPALVAMLLEDFLELVEQWWQGRMR